MKSGWDAYAEAVRLLVRAPEAAQSKRDDAVSAKRKRVAGADTRLREAVTRREAVQERLARLELLIKDGFNACGVPVEGTAEQVKVPSITQVRQVAPAADEFERLVTAAVAGLEQARSQPKPRPLWWYAAAGLAAVTVVVIVILLTV